LLGGCAENAEEITSEEQLEQVATISSNNDPEVGKLIATAMDKVGREGVVTIEESKSGETYLETVEGIQFDRVLGEKKYLYSDISEKQFKAFKKNKDLLTRNELKVLQELYDIKNRKKDGWGS